MKNIRRDHLKIIYFACMPLHLLCSSFQRSHLWSDWVTLRSIPPKYMS